MGQMSAYWCKAMVALEKEVTLEDLQKMTDQEVERVEVICEHWRQLAQRELRSRERTREIERAS